MTIAENLGLAGLILNLIGALLVIDKLVTFKSITKSIEKGVTSQVMKYIKKMAFNFTNEYIKLNPAAKDIQLMTILRERIKINDFPDMEELKQLHKERQNILGKDYQRKHRAKRNSPKELKSTDPRKSAIVRIMILNNRYIISVLIMGFIKTAMEKIIKYQIHIGASLFILGHICQIIEKILG